MTSNVSHMSASSWRESRRLKYNIALASAGLLSFILYATLVWSFQDELPDVEITLFTIASQAIGYFLLMVVANASDVL